MKHLFLLIAITIGINVTLTGYCREGLHLNFEPGVAMPVDEKKEYFESYAGWDLGMRMGYQFGIVQPQISFSYLRFWNDPNNPIYSAQSGFDVPSLGAGLRLTPIESELVNLWLDGNGQAYLAEPPTKQDLAVEEQNPRGQVNAAVGLGFNLTDNLTFGPTVRYDHIFYPSVTDMQVVSAGISFSIRFGGNKEPAQVAYYDENVSASPVEESESAPDVAPDETIIEEEDIENGTNICKEVGIELNQEADFINIQAVKFDFDDASIRPDQREHMDKLVQCFGLFLKEHPQTTMTIEGHCDERGSNEYNIALGHRRAKRIYEELLDTGVTANQMKVLTYGEERPVVEGHDESAWSFNRRSQFIAETTQTESSENVSTAFPPEVPKSEPAIVQPVVQEEVVAVEPTEATVTVEENVAETATATTAETPAPEIATPEASTAEAPAPTVAPATPQEQTDTTQLENDFNEIDEIE